MNPYAEAAPDLLAKGWSPVTLDFGSKVAPPTGTTGYEGVSVTAEQVAAWSRGGPHNVAVRLPPDVIGIDVDDYGDKAGAATLAAAEERCGPLPLTWRSTSRDGLSGIRYFRVPPGRRWANTVGPGIEVIHWGHRYAVVGGPHPTSGGTYGWRSEELDGAAVAAPRTDDLPDFPAAWVKELDRGPAEEPAESPVEDVGEWLRELSDDSPCRRAEGLLAVAEEDLASGESRHDVGARHSMALLRLGEAGHVGVPTALDTLQSMWLKSLNGERADDARGEWSRMVAGAVRKVTASPTPDDKRGCCSTAAEDFGDLFDATPTLAHIRQAAHARMLSAPALLGFVLGRVLAEVPPNVVLPPTIGSPAALNLGLAVVGESGAGKSALLATSGDLLGLTGHWQADIVRNAGSGEGLVQSFLVWDSSTKRNVLSGDPRRVFVVDEVDSFAATTSRSGSTLAPTLRSAVSGTTLGQTNATADRNRHIPANAYRAVVLMGVQPTQSGVLLDGSEARAGTPQRLWWVRALDRTIPDPRTGVRVEWPGPLAAEWSVPDLPPVIDYPEHVKAEVVRARYEQQTDQDAAEASKRGHMLLTRLKVGAALALLHGEAYISEQWWALAGALVADSMAIQEECRAVLAKDAAQKNESRARARGKAEVITSEVVGTDKAGVQRAVGAILRKATEAGPAGVPWSEARAAVQHKDREQFALKARNLLEVEGKVRVEDASAGNRPGERLFLE